MSMAKLPGSWSWPSSTRVGRGGGSRATFPGTITTLDLLLLGYSSGHATTPTKGSSKVTREVAIAKIRKGAGGMCTCPQGIQVGMGRRLLVGIMVVGWRRRSSRYSRIARSSKQNSWSVVSLGSRWGCLRSSCCRSRRARRRSCSGGWKQRWSWRWAMRRKSGGRRGWSLRQEVKNNS